MTGTYGSLTSDVEKGKYLDKVKLACSLKAFQQEVSNNIQQ